MVPQALDVTSGSPLVPIVLRKLLIERFATLGVSSFSFKSLGFLASGLDECPHIPSRGTRKILVKGQKEEGTQERISQVV